MSSFSDESPSVYSKNRIKEPKFYESPDEISKPILSKNGFVKQIWLLPDFTATRSNF